MFSPVTKKKISIQFVDIMDEPNFVCVVVKTAAFAKIVATKSLNLKRMCTIKKKYHQSSRLKNLRISAKISSLFHFKLYPNFYTNAFVNVDKMLRVDTAIIWAELKRVSPSIGWILQCKITTDNGKFISTSNLKIKNL